MTFLEYKLMINYADLLFFLLICVDIMVLIGLKLG